MRRRRARPVTNDHLQAAVAGRVQRGQSPWHPPAHPATEIVRAVGKTDGARPQKSETSAVGGDRGYSPATRPARSPGGVPHGPVPRCRNAVAFAIDVCRRALHDVTQICSGMGVAHSAPMHLGGADGNETSHQPCVGVPELFQQDAQFEPIHKQSRCRPQTVAQACHRAVDIPGSFSRTPTARCSRSTARMCPLRKNWRLATLENVHAHVGRLGVGATTRDGNGLTGIIGFHGKL